MKGSSVAGWQVELETGGEEKRSPHFRSSLSLRVGGRRLLRGISGPGGADGVASLRAAGLEDWTLPTTPCMSAGQREPRPRPVRSLLGRRGCCAGASGSRGPPLPGGSWRSRTQEACRQEGLRVQKSLVSSRPEPVQHQERWGQDAMQAMQPPCEAELPSAALAEGFQLGQAEDEKLQVRAFVWCHLHLHVSGDVPPQIPAPQ
ncbi:uncharacterized protein LOC112548326 [Alligator sinensis]|uniref:Uncharacterized protein LOC112548326 n=1 Tax=Alligator sinensis TaxID=38654 RepID=A0A3Q0FQD3_ALLSI|nr:uncharacterized protein LOC112548326 [Alligator sinensis]